MAWPEKVTELFLRTTKQVQTQGVKAEELSTNPTFCWAKKVQTDGTQGKEVPSPDLRTQCPQPQPGQLALRLLLTSTCRTLLVTRRRLRRSDSPLAHWRGHPLEGVGPPCWFEVPRFFRWANDNNFTGSQGIPCQWFPGRESLGSFPKPWSFSTEHQQAISKPEPREAARNLRHG